jgi:hypothetical protein
MSTIKVDVEVPIKPIPPNKHLQIEIGYAIIFSDHSGVVALFGTRFRSEAICVLGAMNANRTQYEKYRLVSLATGEIIGWE